MRKTKIRLERFRAFSDTGTLTIRPLTFLVGENSSGKTSLLSGLNFLFNLKANSDTPTLNDGPFDLGSFEQIAHRTKDGKNHQTFRFQISKNVNVRASESADGTMNLFVSDGSEDHPDQTTIASNLAVTFGNHFGEVQILQFDFSFENTKLTIGLGQKLTAILSVDGVEHEMFTPKDADNKNASFSSMGIHLLALVCNGLFFAERDKQEREHHKLIARAFAVLNAFLNSFPSAVIAGSPIRSTPERVYSASEVADTADGKGTPYKLRRAKIADSKGWVQLRQGLNKFGSLTGLFSRIDISKLTKDFAGPFQVKLQVGQRRGTIADVGYGVSQTLPMVENLIQSSAPSVFLFQQPEVHLHPKAQAGVGTYLAQYIADHKQNIIVVETHSDFIIDRVRTEIRRGNINCREVAIIYLESVGHDVQCHEILLDKLGNLVGEPDCYRDFFLREQASNIGIDLR